MQACDIPSVDDVDVRCDASAVFPHGALRHVSRRHGQPDLMIGVAERSSAADVDAFKYSDLAPRGASTLAEEGHETGVAVSHGSVVNRVDPANVRTVDANFEPEVGPRPPCPCSATRHSARTRSSRRSRLGTESCSTRTGGGSGRTRRPDPCQIRLATP